MKYLIFAIFTVLFLCNLNAQSTILKTSESETELSTARLLGKTKPVSEMVSGDAPNNLKTKKKSKALKQIPNFDGNTIMPAPMKASALPKGGDPLYQLPLTKELTLDVEPGLVIEGMDSDDSGVMPPDPSMDVSPNHVIQLINSGNGAIMTIFDKQGNIIQDIVELNDFWTEFNVTGLGDPIVLWDNAADRWLISELGTFGTNVMLIAVSDTNDPLGTWNVFEIQSPDLPDYPKYGIWGDSYFITTNEFIDDFIPVYALDRTAILAGDDAAQIVRLGGMTKFGDPNAFQVASPASLNGSTPPPAGSPHYSLRIRDDSWGAGEDAVEVWETSIDWANPSAATVANPTIIPLAAFDAELCDGNIFACVPQADGTLLSALQQVIMYRVNYRNFGSHESIVFNFSVDVDDTNHAGVRWVELRKQGSNDWILYQEGTIAPDVDSRFMGSINMDGGGNILLAYTVAGELSEPSLRFTGRLVGDPLGEMTITEYEFAEGQEIYFGSRWGDYACMTLDPVDDRTFWFTGEYMKSDIWGTKIMNTFLRRDTFDVGPQTFISPQNSAFLTDNESVTVELRNYGYNPSAEFTVSYSMNGAAVQTETISTIIPVDETLEHTFTTTEDMSALGDYEFIVYTEWAQDTAFFNDTLRTIVTQLTHYDAAAVGVDGIDGINCSAELVGDILLQNAGQEIMTSAEVTYQINANTPIVINWTGSLLAGETEAIPINSTDVIDGTNTISVSVALPNGEADQDESNDSILRDFEMLIDSGVELEFFLLTDLFPGETTWEVEDADGNIIFEGGPYTQAQTVFTEQWCIPEECFTFRIFDSFGDGIQFNGVEGTYTITRLSDDVIVSALGNPDFGNELEVEFCADFMCMITGDFFSVNESAAGAEDGSVTVQPLNGSAPYQYSIDGGATFQTSNVFNNLAADTYDIIITDANDCSATITTEIALCNLSVSVEVSPSDNSNADNGVITITAAGENGDFMYSLDGDNYQDSNIFEGLDDGDYTVYVTDGIGCLQTIEVTVDATVAIENTYFGISVEVLPNPTNGVFMLEVRGLPDVNTMRVDILDAAGRILKSDRLINYSGVLRNRLSVVPYPAGVYFVRLRDAQFNQVVRVVKE